MTKSKSDQTPKYRKQKTKTGDRAFVELGARRHYLGSFGSPESRQAFHRLLAEWSANGGSLPAPPDQITIVELMGRSLIRFPRVD